MRAMFRACVGCGEHKPTILGCVNIADGCQTRCDGCDKKCFQSIKEAKDEERLIYLGSCRDHNKKN